MECHSIELPNFLETNYRSDYPSNLYPRALRSPKYLSGETMSERSFNRALRECRRVLQTYNLECNLSSRRTFSTTRRKAAQLPQFQISPENTQLESLTAELRRKVFIPAALNGPQRRLVFKTRHHAMLQSDPITVEVAGEDYTLEPLDITKDIPNTWKSMQEAFVLMGKSRADWSNLPILLSAMRRAGRKWKTWQWERIIRKTGDAGMVEVLLQAVRQVNATGLVLGDLRIVREAFWACRQKAIIGDWNKAETTRALRSAEQLAEMLEFEVHSGTFSKGEDPRVQMDIIGLVLELAAVHAKMHYNGQDHDGKVEMYAKRLAQNLRSFGVDLLQDGTQEGLLAARADYELLRWVPVREALKMSQQILGEKMASREIVKKKLKELNKLCSGSAELVEAADEDQKDKRMGLKWYREAEARP